MLLPSKSKASAFCVILSVTPSKPRIVLSYNCSIFMVCKSCKVIPIFLNDSLTLSLPVMASSTLLVNAENDLAADSAEPPDCCIAIFN